VIKLGDVFKLDEREDLYQVAGIDPLGKVVARKYELDRGPIDELIEFSSNFKVQVLFNSFEPPNIERGWDVCELNYQVEFSERGDWTGILWFEAVILMGDGTQNTILTSPNAPFSRGNNWPNPEVLANHLVHSELIKQLTDDGWVPIIERRSWWWKCRFKRPPQRR
jgi:hypothetical protein